MRITHSEMTHLFYILTFFKLTTSIASRMQSCFFFLKSFFLLIFFMSEQ